MADHIAFVRITEADALIRRLNEQDNL
jgi:hypothetical protein